MNTTLRSMRRVPRAHMKKVFLPRNADHADQTHHDDHEVIASKTFTPVRDAQDHCGPLRTIADRIADQASSTWETLSALRWGPAVGDPTPGIVIDIPNRERMLAALRSRTEGGLA
jgi:hypothetical protein